MLNWHTHSFYSALDGWSSPEEIADRCVEIGLAGCCLTDHGTVAGLGSFRTAMKEKGLFAGFGSEFYQTKNGRDVKGTKRGEDSYHLILLAKNEVGYRNLMRLSDESNRSGFYYVPRVDWELLEKYHEGLIATSACLASLVNEGVQQEDRSALDRMLRIFKDDYFIELHTYTTELQHAVNKELWSIAKERGIPVVYSNDAHYDVPDAYWGHEAFLAAQYGSNMWEEKGYWDGDPARYHPPCLYIMSEDDVRAALNHLPQEAVDQAISNSDLLLDYQFSLGESKLHLPKAKLEPGVSAQDLFVDLVEEGLERLYGAELPLEVEERAVYEMQAIIDAGLHDYFLIVWDYINWALEQGILVGPARGSSGSSLIARALGITTIDPLRYDLYFERFWNPGRAEGLPDIDSDFESAQRQHVLAYLKRKYGDDRVLPISNHSFLWPKAALDKAAMVLKFEHYGDLKRIKDIIETTDDAGKLSTWDEVFEQVGDELEEYVEQYPGLFELGQEFSGRLATYSIHASAVVVAEVDLPEFLPARLAKAEDEGKDKELVTQAEMHEVEKLGWPKFDLLRLLNLDSIVKTAMLSGDFDSED